MISKRKTGLLLVTFLLLALIAVACSPETETIIETRMVEVEKEVTRVVEGEVVTETVIEEVPVEVEVEVTREVVVEEEMAPEPVTLHMNHGTEPPGLDPSLATDTTSVDIIRNIFMGLTQFDPVTGDVLPYLAETWEVGEDADGNQTWTFNLRDDIPWVNYDPIAGVTSQQFDDVGDPRFVNANDVVYGVKRTIDPDTASDYSYVAYVIKNAQGVNAGEEGLTLDDVGVVALDDTTVLFTLESPAPYFPSIAGMWIMHPMPQWAIEEWEQKWTEAGLIATNGPYVLEEWIHGGNLNLVKNDLWPMADEVQIERVEGLMIVEASTSFALYENNELDTTGVPLPEMDRVQADPVLSEEYLSAPDVCTYYYGFTNTKYPMTDRRVRAAFSQAIDRQSLIDNVLKGGQIASTSFAPPGIFGAPAPGEVGLGYDPEAAQALLQEFLDEEGLTIDDFNALDIVLMHNTSEGHARIAAAIQQMWQDTLGVDVRVENQEWAVYLDTVQKVTPVEQMPHVWRMGWCADYADENNWVHEVFNSDAGANRLRRNCLDANCSETTTSRFDELTVAAQLATEPAERAELYLEAEKILSDDEAAYASIYHYTTVNVTKPWLTRNFPLFGGNDWFNWVIDQDAKMDATG
ncbi:MAG: peptide ABC transporter substrate-binding protein [Candidatus Promineifilaceae bacterium]